MEILYGILQVACIALILPVTIMLIGIVGNIIMLLYGLLTLDASVIKDTFFWEACAEMKEKRAYRRAWKQLGRQCKKCGGKNIHPDTVVFNRGSENQFIEKLLICSDCGRTVSDQWPQYW
jgi:hypothetical protein